MRDTLCIGNAMMDLIKRFLMRNQRDFLLRGFHTMEANESVFGTEKLFAI